MPATADFDIGSSLSTGGLGAGFHRCNDGSGNATRTSLRSRERPSSEQPSSSAITFSSARRAKCGWLRECAPIARPSATRPRSDCQSSGGKVGMPSAGPPQSFVVPTRPVTRNRVAGRRASTVRPRPSSRHRTSASAWSAQGRGRSPPPSAQAIHHRQGDSEHSDRRAAGSDRDQGRLPTPLFCGNAVPDAGEGGGVDLCPIEFLDLTEKHHPDREHRRRVR